LHPAVVKAAFVVGAQYGRGVASCRTAGGWSAPAFVAIGGGSFGAQIGVQSTDLVLFVMSDHGMRQLLNSKVELGAYASAAAGPVGRDAAAATDWKLRAEVLAYSRSRGLFAGVDLGGAVITRDHERAREAYGVDPDYRALLEGTVAWPASGSELLATLSESGRARDPAVSSR
jgi:lipid-binding SYLF domain-containing protein